MKLYLSFKSVFKLFTLVYSILLFATIGINTAKAQTIASTLPIANIIAIDLNTETNRIYACSGGTIFVIDGEENKIVDTMELSSFGEISRGIGVNSSTNSIYVDNFDGTVNVVDGETNRIVDLITVYEPIPLVFIDFLPFPVSENGIDVNPVTNRIYVSHMPGNTISVIDGDDNKVIADITIDEVKNIHEIVVQGIEINEARNHIYVANEKDSKIVIIDGESNQVIGSINVDEPPFSLGLNHLTNRLYASSLQSNIVSVIDIDDNQVIAKINIGGFSKGIDIHPSINHIYVANPDCGVVRVIDGDSNKVINTITAGSWPVAISVNHTTNLVYIADRQSNGLVLHDDGSIIIEEPTQTPAMNIGKNNISFFCNNRDMIGNPGFNNLTLKLGEEASCLLSLSESVLCDLAVSPITVKPKRIAGLKPSITIEPSKASTNEKGELLFTIKTIAKGFDRIIWAVQDERGRFKFDRESFVEGRAWSILVNVN